MKRKLSTKLLLILALSSALFALCSLPSALCQVPQGFNYQAIIRDGVTKQPITSQPVLIRVTIEDGIETDLYQETHSLSTDEFGIISIIVGQGTPSGATVFNEIDWNDEPLNLKTEVQYPVGGSYTLMGIAPLMSVPYAMVADSLSRPLAKLSVTGETTDMEEALFEVRNKDGNTVFAVYNEGVRIYVGDGDVKGPKGGFAIGGFGSLKDENNKRYFFVDDDSVRVYLNGSGKSAKGGFAIGGYGTVKGDQKFLTVSYDSVRIYVDNDETDKGVKGGFAIGGYGTNKGKPQKLLTVSDDSVRIYINDAAKGPKGGFAIGGFDQAKGDGNNTNFFNVSTSADETINPSQNRILWYPLKNAFLTGKVLVEDPDSIGTNSMATGYESKALGDQSQAMGYQAISRGDYSTSIGYQSLANKGNSFAFGQWAKALNQECYALGRGAVAEGFRSYAFGSAGIDSAGALTGVAYSKGDYSFALGQGSRSLGIGSFAIGVLSEASGEYSTALGYKTLASGFGSLAAGNSTKSKNDFTVALGNYTLASGYCSTAFGEGTRAIEEASTAMGWYTVASGIYSTSMSFATKAKPYASVAIGQFNDTTCSSLGQWNWVLSDPVFIIGNGTGDGPELYRHNAFTVLKNGKTAIGHGLPTQMLDVDGNARFRAIPSGSGDYLVADVDGNIFRSASDLKMKTNIESLSGGLEKILLLRGVQFNWKDKEDHLKSIGFIAQEVEKVLPELVFTNPVDGYKGINYAEMTAVLTEAVKEQQKQIEELKEIISRMEERISSLRSQ